jgi:hypothetical protein
VTVGEDHQLAKQSTGLDAGQVIRWKSWHHWTVLCLFAYLCRDEPDHGSWHQREVLRPSATDARNWRAA